MSIALSNITQAITSYSTQFSDADLQQLQDAIKNCGENITDRSNLPGHITTSAVIINKDNRILHIKHKILNRWLLPGGHCETIDKTLVEASLREVKEETGISLKSMSLLDPTPIDIDIHNIPASPKKKEPEHWHADLRFAFQIDSANTIQIQEEEVMDYEWLSLEEMSMRRLANRVYDLICQS